MKELSVYHPGITLTNQINSRGELLTTEPEDPSMPFILFFQLNTCLSFDITDVFAATLTP